MGHRALRVSCNNGITGISRFLTFDFDSEIRSKHRVFEVLKFSNLTDSKKTFDKFIKAESMSIAILFVRILSLMNYVNRLVNPIRHWDRMSVQCVQLSWRGLTTLCEVPGVTLLVPTIDNFTFIFTNSLILRLIYDYTRQWPLLLPQLLC